MLRQWELVFNLLGRGELSIPLIPYDTVGNPHRTQIDQFELFELILLLKLNKQFPVEQFEATVSRSRGPSPPLRYAGAAAAARGRAAAGR